MYPYPIVRITLAQIPKNIASPDSPRCLSSADWRTAPDAIGRLGLAGRVAAAHVRNCTFEHARRTWPHAKTAPKSSLHPDPVPSSPQIGEPAAPQSAVASTGGARAGGSQVCGGGFELGPPHVAAREAPAQNAQRPAPLDRSSCRLCRAGRPEGRPSRSRPSHWRRCRGVGSRQPAQTGWLARRTPAKTALD